MSILVAVDPGVTYTGVAVFDRKTKTLLRAKHIKGVGFYQELWGVLDLAKSVVEYAHLEHQAIDSVVFEWPQIYPGRARGKKDPNDLLPLTALEGMVLALLDRSIFCDADMGCELLKPHAWKGSKKANPTARWILSCLTEAEKASIEASGNFVRALDEAEAAGKDVGHPVHNSVDAVGIGLRHLGRLNRHRVLAKS